MKEFKVTITETLKRSVVVKAKSSDDAWDRVWEQYHNADIVLDAEDFEDVHLTVTEIKED